MFCGAKLIVTIALKAEIQFEWCLMLLNSLFFHRVGLMLHLVSQRRRTMGHAARRSGFHLLKISDSECIMSHQSVLPLQMSPEYDSCTKFSRKFGGVAIVPTNNHVPVGVSSCSFISISYDHVRAAEQSVEFSTTRSAPLSGAWYAVWSAGVSTGDMEVVVTSLSFFSASTRTNSSFVGPMTASTITKSC